MTSSNYKTNILFIQDTRTRHDPTRGVFLYPLCGVDQVKESQHGDRDPYGRAVHHGNQRLGEVDVRPDVLPEETQADGLRWSRRIRKVVTELRIDPERLGTGLNRTLGLFWFCSVSGEKHDDVDQ